MEDHSTISLDQSEPVTVYRQIGGGRNEFYLYDAKGNRIRKTLMETDILMEDYSYYQNSDWLRTAGQTAYKYDNNGNMTEKGNDYTENGDDVTINQA